MTIFEWLTLGYILIVMVPLAICLHVRREIKGLRAENRMLCAQYELLRNAFKSVATDWAKLLHSEERFGIHNRPVAPGEGNDADSSAEQE